MNNNNNNNDDDDNVVKDRSSSQRFSEMNKKNNKHVSESIECTTGHMSRNHQSALTFPSSWKKQEQETE